jgi:hypothetical protein
MNFKADCYSIICMEGLKKTTKIVVGIAGLRSEKQVQDLPITK